MGHGNQFMLSDQNVFFLHSSVVGTWKCEEVHGGMWKYAEVHRGTQRYMEG